MKWLDIPPVWLAGMAFLTWHSRGPLGALSFGYGIAQRIGAALIAAGIAIFFLVFLRMQAHKTTPIPHMSPNALVTDGIFALTRNPIYLGELFILSRPILRWNAPLAIPLVFLFQFILLRRFILPDEAWMREHFGVEFDQYAEKTPRWL